MAAKRARQKDKTVIRTGTPFTVYFSEEQTRKLNHLSRERRVTKAELLRFAVDRLVEELNGGQLELPLGVQL